MSILPGAGKRGTGELVRPRADVENGLLGVRGAGETGERRRRVTRGVADLGGVAAGDADGGRDVGRQLGPVREPAAVPLPADPDRAPDGCVGAAGPVQ